MAYAQTTIYLGDLTRALDGLEPADEETQLAIAHTLGLHWEPRERRERAPRHEPAADLDPDYQPETTRRPRFDTDIRPLASTLEHTASDQPETSIYVPPLAPSGPEDHAEPPKLEPLFFQQWARGIISAALATPAAFGPIDVDRVVDALSRREQIKELPFLSTRTLARGVQLLIDRSEAMTPFRRDQAKLREDLLRVVGRDRVATLRFVGCPTRGAGSGGASEWTRYGPPLPGTPVLLLTDLGIGRPRLSDERAGLAEWIEFAELLRKAGCPLLAMVPYSASRWPPSLTRYLTILEWDRRTTATTVSNRLKRQPEVRP